MRTFKALFRTYRVNERDYKQLVRRFDVEKIETLSPRLNAIDIPCICGVYNGCKGCPFSKGETTCEDVLDDLELEPKYATLWPSWIRLLQDKRSEAKQEIQAIRDWILSWEKVE